MKKLLMFVAFMNTAALVGQPNDGVKRFEALDARVIPSTSGFYVEPNLPDYTKARLRVVGATGEVQSQFFATGEDLVFSPASDLADGPYTWELLVWDSSVKPEARPPETFSPARANDTAAPRWITSGSFRLENGAVTLEKETPTIDADLAPTTDGEGGLETARSAATNHNAGTLSASGNACVGDPICSAAYQPIDDFEVLDGGGNARILFRNATTNPTVYWDVGTTPSAFVIEDEVTPGTPDILTLEEGARDHALYIDSTGNIGLGTDAPAHELHVSGSSPYIRLDNGTNTWDLSSNSGFMWFSNNGSFPFVVDSDAPDESLWIDALGRIGLGTQNPAEAIELEDTTGTQGTFLIDQQGADASVEVMFNLVCNCAPGFRMQNSVNGQTWFFRHTSAGDFSFDDPNSAGQEMRLTPTGNLFIGGSLSQGSSRALKEHLTPYSGDELLAALDSLGLYEWSYIDQDARHFGPMAEDFAKAYGLGKGNTKIAPADVAGVALAAAKTLREKNVALEEQLHSVLERLSVVEELLEQQQ